MATLGVKVCVWASYGESGWEVFWVCLGKLMEVLDGSLKCLCIILNYGGTGR